MNLKFWKTKNEKPVNKLQDHRLVFKTCLKDQKEIVLGPLNLDTALEQFTYYTSQLECSRFIHLHEDPKDEIVESVLRVGYIDSIRIERIKEGVGEE